MIRRTLATATPFLLVAALSGGSPALAQTTDFACGTPAKVVEGRLEEIASGDLDSNGILDLVFINEYQMFPWPKTEILVSLGTGGGNYAPPVAYPAGERPITVTICDLNGDSRADLVAPDFGGAGGVAVLLNQGGGTFASADIYPVLSSYLHAAVDDLDGDGHPDLAVGTLSGVAILLNDGTGHFGPALPLNAGGSSIRVATGDLDGDGAPDLAVARELAKDVILLRNLGGGAFAVSATYDFEDYCESVAVCDFDQDGFLDVAAAGEDTQDGGRISVWFNDGAGNLQNRADYPATHWLSSLVAGDLDGDGHIDLVSDGGNKLFVTFNDGAGAFAPVTSIACPVSYTQYGVTAGDFDQDGDTDLTTMSGAPVGPVWTSFSILVENIGPAASSVAFNGSGVNCDGCFVALSEPVLGTLWTTRVGPASGPLIPTLVFLTSAKLFAPLPLQPGELLVAITGLGGQTLLLDGSATDGSTLATHSIPVPNNSALAGVRIFGQAALFEPTGALLTNALELVLGTH